MEVPAPALFAANGAYDLRLVLPKKGPETGLFCVIIHVSQGIYHERPGFFTALCGGGFRMRAVFLLTINERHCPY